MQLESTRRQLTQKIMNLALLQMALFKQAVTRLVSLFALNFFPGFVIGAFAESSMLHECSRGSFQTDVNL